MQSRATLLIADGGIGLGVSDEVSDQTGEARALAPGMALIPIRVAHKWTIPGLEKVNRLVIHQFARF